MSRTKELVVALVLFVGAAVGGCQSPSGSPGHSAHGHGGHQHKQDGGWPDFFCKDAGEYAYELLDEIEYDADFAFALGELSYEDYVYVITDIYACRGSESDNYDDKAHCAYVIKARNFERNGAWIKCAKTLELGHM